MPTPASADLKGRTCLVTGASTGIGREIARGIARTGATVVLGCRSAERGEEARKDIMETTGNQDVHVMLVDVSSQRSLRAFAADFDKKHDKLHLLVNNAGIWTTTKQLSEDGIELMWATNVLGYHLLTALLLPKLKASAPARIVNVASTAASGLDLDDPLYEKRKFSHFTGYGATKQANRMLTWDLAERLAGTGVTANAGNPGFIKSGLSRDAKGGLFGFFFSKMQAIMAKTPVQGAQTFIWMATSPDLEGVSGKFYSDLKEMACKFREPEAIKRLVAICDRQIAPR